MDGWMLGSNKLFVTADVVEEPWIVQIVRDDPRLCIVTPPWLLSLCLPAPPAMVNEISSHLQLTYGMNIR